ncbi:MAG TPA: ATP-binding protein [Candidatus Omnitrophota bacterium]|nr:ATP-binding protein [Candidatus Omnitrophota bacterium]HPS20062.1 ATP-binding protein [Candidatus Omnitrophota bacterium]
MPVKNSQKIENNSRLLKEVSKDLIVSLKDKGINEGLLFDIQISFEEALRNAMVHGNKSRDDKKVKIDTEIRDDEVIISVEDEGDGFDPSRLPDPTQGDNILREGGRGVYLIKHLMDNVKFELGGRRIVMSKKLKK